MSKVLGVGLYCLYSHLSVSFLLRHLHRESQFYPETRKSSRGCHLTVDTFLRAKVAKTLWFTENFPLLKISVEFGYNSAENGLKYYHKKNSLKTIPMMRNNLFIYSFLKIKNQKGVFNEIIYCASKRNHLN